MKRDRRAEGEDMLRSGEAELRAQLLEALPRVVRTRETLFVNSRFKPPGFPAKHISKESEALLDLALACVEMREALELPESGSVGKLFMEACEENASSNEHRRGPRKLAAALLSAIQSAA
jgi:hypothetical protein